APGGALAGGAPGRGGRAPRPAVGRTPDAGRSRSPPYRPGADAHQRSDRGGGGGAGHPPQHPDPQDEGVRPVREPVVQALPPLRVEKALGLLPDLEALEPLRSLLVSISRPDERALWSDRKSTRLNS